MFIHSNNKQSTKHIIQPLVCVNWRCNWMCTRGGDNREMRRCWMGNEKGHWVFSAFELPFEGAWDVADELVFLFVLIIAFTSSVSIDQ